MPLWDIGGRSWDVGYLPCICSLKGFLRLVKKQKRFKKPHKKISRFEINVFGLQLLPTM